MSGSLTLVTGGIKSGKTAFALGMANRFHGKVYLATSEIVDDEMRARVDAHRAERGPEWMSLEEPVDLAGALGRASAMTSDGVILVDCITMWINNLLYHDKDVNRMIDDAVDALASITAHVIVVTNEVGFGIVPADAKTRHFARILGEANARLAALADNVHLLVSGIPVHIKQSHTAKEQS